MEKPGPVVSVKPARFILVEFRIRGGATKVQNLRILILFQLIAFAAISNASDRFDAKTESPEVRERISALISQEETRVFRPFYTFMVGIFVLKNDIHDLENLLERYRRENVYIGPETQRDMIKRLINLHAHTRSKHLLHPIERIIIMYGDDRTPEAAEFVVSLLSSDSEKTRESAWDNLYFTRIHSDMVYDKLTALESKNQLSQRKSLIAKMRINFSRALPESHAFLATTDNMEDFRQIADHLGYKGDLGMAGIAIERYKRTKNKSFIYSVQSRFWKSYLESCKPKKLQEVMGIMSTIGYSEVEEITTHKK
jgi:hypothetical protein